MRRALAPLALCAALWGASAQGELYSGTTRIADVYVGSTRVCDVVAVDAERRSHTIHRVGTPPAIAEWRASKVRYLSTDPLDITLTWRTSGATGLSITAGQTTIGAITGGAVASGSQRWEVPSGVGSAGVDITLHAQNTAETGCSRDATAKVHVVVLRAPAITAMSASPPASASGPFTFEQCSTITWSAVDGDPAAEWSFSQSGFYLPHLPSDRRATPASSPQRVCTSRTPGASTTITLTGRNAAGSIQRSVSIPWAGQ